MDGTGEAQLTKLGIVKLGAIAALSAVSLWLLTRAATTSGRVGFMPHGYCYLWDPLVLWLNVISDALITLSYYCIPIALIYVAHKRRELPFNRIFWMFGMFILACGTTHLMEVWNIWHANYLLSGVIKAFTAAVSVATAVMILPLLPNAIRMPGSIDLLETNRRLEQEIAKREPFDASVENSFRRRVNLGFVVAVVLTVFVGILVWRHALQTEQDESWVYHTHEAIEAIQRTTRGIIEAGTSARAFSLSGEEPLLAHYQKAHDTLLRDEAALRHLTADNPSQQARLDTLEPRLRALLEFSDGIIARRREMHTSPGNSVVMETDGLVESARTITRAMYQEEARLLGERNGRAVAGQRWTRIIAFGGVFLGVGLCGFAKLAVNREIDISSRVRAEISMMNSELEMRVRERTAELEAINVSLEKEILARAEEEKARRGSEERLAEQARALDMATVLVREMDGRIALWTQGAQKLYGYSAEDAVGQISHELFRTKFPASQQAMETELAENGRWEGELEHRKKNGDRVFVASVQVVYRDQQGRAVRILEGNTDITRRKQDEERMASQAEELTWQAEDLMRTKESLRAQGEIFALVLNSVGEGLVAADKNGKFLLWNPAAERIFGRGPAAVPIAEWSEYYDMFMPDGVTPFPAPQLPLVRAMLGEETEAEMVVHNPQSGKARWIEASAHPMRDAAGESKGGVVALRDATQRKSDEREIRRLNENLERRVVERTAELQAANKELEAFTYTVSHDLRAPLRHISGFTRILVEDFGPALPEEAQRHLERIEQGTIRMGRLVDELLTLTRVGRQSLAVQVTGLDPIVKDVITMLEPETKDRRVDWKIGALPFVECDPTLIHQVFQNLISNALKYSRPRAPAVIEIGQMEIDGNAVIFVRDNGVGFSMKYVDKLFGVFQRLHRAEDFEGTGVGLATVHRIIQKHGGRIWAEAELDRGASFYFTLNGLGNGLGNGSSQSLRPGSVAAAGGQA